MSRISYMFDNRTRATKFLSSLDSKTIKLRFANMADWKPHHIVLVLKDDVVVAMADAVSTADNRCATASLIARPGQGAYAVKAFLKLKKHVERIGWFATLRAPTPATLAISRRYFDMVFEQGAWELSNTLMQEHGPHAHLMASPIIASDSFLKEYQVPSLDKLTPATRAQIATAAAKIGQYELEAPSGNVLGGQELMSLAFDVVDLPFQDRRNITRMLLFATAAAHGHNIDPAYVRKLSDPSSMSRFGQALTNCLDVNTDIDGLFVLRRMEKNATADFLRAVERGDLPSSKRVLG